MYQTDVYVNICLYMDLPLICACIAKHYDHLDKVFLEQIILTN